MAKILLVLLCLIIREGTMRAMEKYLAIFKGYQFLTLGSGHYLRVGGWCKSENHAHSKFAPPRVENRALKICPPRKPRTEILPPLKVCQPCIVSSGWLSNVCALTFCPPQVLLARKLLALPGGPRPPWRK